MLAADFIRKAKANGMEVRICAASERIPSMARGEDPWLETLLTEVGPCAEDRSPAPVARCGADRN